MNERQVRPTSDEPAGRIGEPLHCPAATTRRPISEGAEKWLGVPIRVLDHGYVYLVDYMGNDEAIVQAARVSYGRGTKTVSSDRGLIRTLRREMHTSPFEMAELKFHMKLPIFVARQVVRHRTASLNEVSGRYSILEDEFFVPNETEISGPDPLNRQGRGAPLPAEARARAAEIFATTPRGCYAAYEELLQLGVARELARIILPLNIYTQWYWKIDLHNLFHFLRLRLDTAAQPEVIAYAQAITHIVQCAFPLAWEAFEDYTLRQVPLSRLEVEVLRRLGLRLRPEQLWVYCDEVGLKSRRERAQFAHKLTQMGLLDDRRFASQSPAGE